jgi:hypothetical protein
MGKKIHKWLLGDPCRLLYTFTFDRLFEKYELIQYLKEKMLHMTLIFIFLLVDDDYDCSFFNLVFVKYYIVPYLLH